jgi:hypothetical protein
VPHALVLKADALAALTQAGVDLAQFRKEATTTPGACTGDPSEADDELEENLERDRAPNDLAAASSIASASHLGGVGDAAPSRARPLVRAVAKVGESAAPIS